MGKRGEVDNWTEMKNKINNAKVVKRARTDTHGANDTWWDYECREKKKEEKKALRKSKRDKK